MVVPRVRIDGTGSYLPGEAVGIEQVESVLGRLDGLPERLAGRLDQFRQRLLSRSGVERRYFAIDPVDRRQTETNASLAEKAARQALQAAQTEAGEVDLLVCSNCAADCFTPPTSALIQQRLGIQRCTEIEIHSNCTGVPKSLQIAMDMLRQGRYRKALVIYTQLSSLFLRSEFYNPAKVTLEHITLRWMLSDGAGAMLLSLADDDQGGPELIDAYVESVGCDEAPGMKMVVGGRMRTGLGSSAHAVPACHLRVGHAPPVARRGAGVRPRRGVRAQRPEEHARHLRRDPRRGGDVCAAVPRPAFPQRQAPRIARPCAGP